MIAVVAIALALGLLLGFQAGATQARLHFLRHQEAMRQSLRWFIDTARNDLAAPVFDARRLSTTLDKLDRTVPVEPFITEDT